MSDMKTRRIHRLARGAALACAGAAATVMGLPTSALAEAAPQEAAQAAIQAPTLQFSKPNSQLLFGRAYDRAVDNVFRINQIQAVAADLDSGLLTGSPPMKMRAGGGYDDAWTRDASVNSWNAGSLVAPDLARNTLWAVVDKQSNGQLIVQQDNQWWDQVIWVTAAWEHYLLTGDMAFVKDAYQAAVNTLATRKAANYSATLGLFKGPSFFNDGIAAYPSPPADDTESLGGFVLSYPETHNEAFLSTNALYQSAYKSVALMGEVVGAPAGDISAFKAMASSLKKKINERLWLPHRNTYGFFLHNEGNVPGAIDEMQEGSGISFAILFGIANETVANKVLSSATVHPWGMVDTYPNLTRYSDQKPGRHNAIVWPVVQGFWADAAARMNRQDLFAKEVARLAKLANNNSGFWEIYHAHSGVVDGGWQTGSHWGSQPDQTWSASAYLRWIFTDVVGLRPTRNGLDFEPLLPSGWGDVTVSNLRYRNATLTVRLHGDGKTITSFKLDGQKQKPHLPNNLSGAHTIDINLVGGLDGDRDADGVVDSIDDCSDEAGVSEANGCPSPELMQAEDAFNSGGPMVADNHTGYAGRGFMEGPRVQGAALDFTVHRRSGQAKPYAVSVRYSNGNTDTRTLSLYADGVKIKQLSFAPTGSWDQWADLQAGVVTLNGKTPHLVLKWDSGDNGRMNIDSMSARPQ